MGSASCSPVNCATGDGGAVVVVGAGGLVVVVGGGTVVGVGATATVVVVEVGEGDRRLVPAPLQALAVNSRTQIRPKGRAKNEGKRSLNTNGFPTAESNPLGRVICVPLGGRKYRV